MRILKFKLENGKLVSYFKEAEFKYAIKTGGSVRGYCQDKTGEFETVYPKDVLIIDYNPNFVDVDNVKFILPIYEATMVFPIYKDKDGNEFIIDNPYFDGTNGPSAEIGEALAMSIPGLKADEKDEYNDSFSSTVKRILVNNRITSEYNYHVYLALSSKARVIMDLFISNPTKFVVDRFSIRQQDSDQNYPPIEITDEELDKILSIDSTAYEHNELISQLLSNNTFKHNKNFVLAIWHGVYRYRRYQIRSVEIYDSKVMDTIKAMSNIYGDYNSNSAYSLASDENIEKNLAIINKHYPITLDEIVKPYESIHKYIAVKNDIQYLNLPENIKVRLKI